MFFLYKCKYFIFIFKIYDWIVGCSYIDYRKLGVMERWKHFFFKKKGEDDDWYGNCCNSEEKAVVL